MLRPPEAPRALEVPALAACTPTQHEVLGFLDRWPWQQYTNALVVDFFFLPDGDQEQG
jgi:hypothetical protein